MPKYNDFLNRGSFANAHEQMQNLVINLKREFQFETLFDDVIYGEKVAVTPGAQLMLIIPLIEAIAMQGYWQENGAQDTALNIDQDVIRQSLKQLIREAKVNPARADNYPDELYMEDGTGKAWSMRSSFSIIKSFAGKFCNIPPFCGEKG